MKLAILTQPISTNYGGILQAYVLQAFLFFLGHVVVILNFKEKKLNLYDKSVIFLKGLYSGIFLDVRILIFHLNQSTKQ